MTEVPAGFERRRPPWPDTGWFEAHLTLAHGVTGSIVVWTSVHPDKGHAEQSCVVWPTGGRPVAMIEADIPIPANRWEFRTSGLWVEQVCETPHVHWSYGLEAFALELDDPTELIRTGYGTRVPMGWELDFVAASRSRWLLIGAEPLEVAGAYTQRGELSGVLLDRNGEAPTSSTSQRWHWWGTKPLTSAGIEVPPIEDAVEHTEELHLPLSQGPIIVARTPTQLWIRAVDSLAS